MQAWYYKQSASGNSNSSAQTPAIPQQTEQGIDRNAQLMVQKLLRQKQYPYQKIDFITCGLICLFLSFLIFVGICTILIVKWTTLFGAGWEWLQNDKYYSILIPLVLPFSWFVY